jgi:hypothetical protein
MLFQSGNMFVWFPAAVLAHHTLETLLKSALIREGYTIAKGKPQDGCVWGHNLVELAQLLASKRQDFPCQLSKDLAVFDAFFNELRYPQTVEEVLELGQDEGILFSQLMEAIRPFAAPLRDPFTG